MLARFVLDQRYRQEVLFLQEVNFFLSNLRSYLTMWWLLKI